MPGLAVAIDAFDSNFVSSGADLVSSVQNLGNQGAADATQGTDNNKPKLVPGAINGCPAFQGRHDGTNASQLAIADSAALDYSQFTLFAVASRVTDLAANEMICGKWNTTGNQREHRAIITAADTVGAQATNDGSTSATPLASGAALVNIPFITMTYYDGTNVITQRNNGTAVSAALASQFNGTANYTIFSATGLTDPYAGYLGAVYFFTRALLDAERQRVVRFLAPRWKIQIS